MYVRSNSLLKKGSVLLMLVDYQMLHLNLEFQQSKWFIFTFWEKITSSLHYNLFYGQTPIQTNDSYLVDKVSELELIVDQQQKEIESLMNR